MKRRLERFVELIEAKRYYDAHEVLEEYWFGRRFEPCREVGLIKGFINAAVSFELLKRNRVAASKKVWANYLKYRALLYKVQSEHISDYHAVVRYLDHKRAVLLKDPA